ncbi:MAG: hypothetical protein BalsKO_09390 [Balneolaceae bacterium]
MKRLFITVGLVLLSLLGYAQEIEYEEYSYSEFFQMIEEEEDSVFELSDAIIQYDEETDIDFAGTLDYNTGIIGYFRKDTLIVYKKLILTNVQFISSFEDGKGEGVLHTIIFQKEVDLTDVIDIYLDENVFEEKLTADFSLKVNAIAEYHQNNLIGLRDVTIIASTFKNSYWLNFRNRESEELAFNVRIFNSEFRTKTKEDGINEFTNFNDLYDINSSIRVQNINFFQFTDNTISQNSIIHSYNNGAFFLTNNTFEEHLYINVVETDDLRLENNDIDGRLLFSIDQFTSQTQIDWQSFSNRILNYRTYFLYFQELAQSQEITYADYLGSWFNDSLHTVYSNEIVFEDAKVFKGEQKLRAQFLELYKSQYDIESVNQVNIEMKDMELKRYEVLFKQNPTFENFFRWKINQFLKIFSDYGTRPEKAVVFSFYVILFFAFFYLFFPNSWDSHGKDRIFHRYAFFLKYMRKDAGLHEVYLEEKHSEIMHYDEFKNLIIESDPSVPKFFTKTAFSLYKWTMSGTQLTASLLSKTDIMKGTWEELPHANRMLKGFLLISAFLLVLVWDLMIKALNALMLSINTFTTLGFGEIPIKGLPRYLAIIQGFIGWFMLTIFSVSLISQLLN